MKQIILTGLTLVFCLSIYAQGQIGPLKVGDRVPDSFWAISHKYFKSGKVFKQDLSVYRGKLVVIDFWAISCVPCLKDMPKQLEVLKKVGQNVGLVRTTYAKEGQIQKFYSSRTNLIGDNFESIILDTVLLKIFPHSLIPHMVWIGEDGFIKSFTDGEAFNADEISLALRNRYAERQKEDLALNVPMYMDRIPINMMSINMLFKGHVDGLGSGNEYRVLGDKTGYLIKNFGLRWLYTSVAMKKYTWFGVHRIVLKFKDDEQFNNYQLKKENHWTLDFWLPTRDSLSLFSRMFDYLNENTGYWAEAKKLSTKCLVLSYSPNNKSTDLSTHGGNTINRLFRADGKLVNAPVKYLLNRVQDQKFITSPVVDETGIIANVDMVINRCENLEELKLALSPYGLILSESIRELDMLVISKK